MLLTTFTRIYRQLLPVLLLLLYCSNPAPAQGRYTQGDPDSLPALIPYRNKELWGFAHEDGSIAIEPQFNYVDILSDSLFAGHNKSGDLQTYLYNAQGGLIRTYAPGPSVFGRFFLFSKDKIFKYGSPRSIVYELCDIYDRAGHKLTDSTGYYIPQEHYNTHYLPVGKKIGYDTKWGLLDTSFNLIEPFNYEHFLLSENTYLRVRDSLGKLYVGYPNKPYHKWPINNINSVYEEIPGYFLYHDNSQNSKLIRYDGKIIKKIKPDYYIHCTANSPYFIIQYATPSRPRSAGIIDKNGHIILNTTYAEIEYAAGDLFLVKDGDRSEYYNSIYDASSTSFLISRADGYDQINYIGNSVFLLSKGTATIAYNLKTRQKLPLGNEHTITYTVFGCYVQYSNGNQKILQDLFNFDHKISDIRLTDAEASLLSLVTTTKNDKQGVFNLDAWKEILPPRFTSVQLIHPHSIMAWDSSGTYVYTPSGRIIFKSPKQGKLVGTSPSHLIIEAGDEAIIIDTSRHRIANIPAALSYSFTETGYVLVSYADHLSAINLSTRTIKEISGTIADQDPLASLLSSSSSRHTSTTYKLAGFANADKYRRPLSDAFIMVKKNGMLAVYDTRNFNEIIPYKYSSDHYFMNAGRGLFILMKQGRQKELGYINARGFEYWQD